MATANSIVTRSLRLIGVIQPGEALTAADEQTGLEALNGMMGSWANDRLLVYHLVQENFALSSASSFTIGPGGAFNTVRPVMIDGGFIRESDQDYPLRVIGRDDYDRISSKSTQDRPDRLFYDPSFPLGRVYFYPSPTGGTAFLNMQKILQSFPAGITAVSLPPGYEEALAYSLAVRIAPEYGRPISQEVASVAVSTLAGIQRINAPDIVSRYDTEIVRRRHYDITQG